MEKVICVYTCNRDKDFNKKLVATEWYKKVVGRKDCRIYFVYANPAIESDFEFDESNNVLVVKAIEKYHKLCLKTYQMIKACMQLSHFDYLVKLDATLIDYRMEHVTFSEFAETFDDDRFYKAYNGLFPVQPGARFGGVKRWAVRYNIPNLDLDKVPYIYDVSFWWQGKCYVLGHDFCEFVVTNGEQTADDFAKYVGGSEDLMVGKLYKDYAATKH